SDTPNGGRQHKLSHHCRLLLGTSFATHSQLCDTLSRLGGIPHCAWSSGTDWRHRANTSRPDEITALSILIGTSQLLGLPLLVYFIVKRHYALVPVAVATI